MEDAREAWVRQPIGAIVIVVAVAVAVAAKRTAAGVAHPGVAHPQQRTASTGAVAVVLSKVLKDHQAPLGPQALQRSLALQDPLEDQHHPHHPLGAVDDVVVGAAPGVGPHVVADAKDGPRAVWMRRAPVDIERPPVESSRILCWLI